MGYDQYVESTRDNTSQQHLVFDMLVWRGEVTGKVLQGSRVTLGKWVTSKFQTKTTFSS